MNTESSSCQCIKCQAACMYKPGWFKPGEAERAAKLLDMSFDEFFKKYLGVNWYVKDEGDIFVLAPATTEMSAGTEYPFNPIGKCVFYKDGLCQIHEAKPFECSHYIHDQNSELIESRKEEIAEAWTGHQNDIKVLLSREPQSEDADIFSMLGLCSSFFR